MTQDQLLECVRANRRWRRWRKCVLVGGDVPANRLSRIVQALNHLADIWWSKQARNLAAESGRERPRVEIVPLRVSEGATQTTDLRFLSRSPVAQQIQEMEDVTEVNDRSGAAKAPQKALDLLVEGKGRAVLVDDRIIGVRPAQPAQKIAVSAMQTEVVANEIHQAPSRHAWRM